MGLKNRQGQNSDTFGELTFCKKLILKLGMIRLKCNKYPSSRMDSAANSPKWGLCHP